MRPGQAILTANGPGITTVREGRLGDRRSRCCGQRNYLSRCVVMRCVSVVAIRLSAARAVPAADNVELAHRREDGWTTGRIQERLRPLRQAALLLSRLLLSRTLSSGRKSSLNQNQPL